MTRQSKTPRIAPYKGPAGGYGDWSTYCSSQVAQSAYPLTLLV